MPRSITQCIYISKLEKFKIISLKGKICSSGFGVAWATSERQTNSGDAPDTNNVTNPPENSTGHYLFIEEVLYLHERGVLEAYLEPLRTDTSNTESDAEYNEEVTDQKRTLLSTSNLYELMLHTMKVPLAVYLTYSHLRSQTYVVLRHTSHSLELLKRVQEEEEISQFKNITRKETESKDDKASFPSNGKHVKMLLRLDQFQAPIPLILRSNNVTEDYNQYADSTILFEKYIAFDVFNPNGNFRKTNPGLPDFCVAISLFNEESTNMNTLRGLVKSCKPIPLKICAISDGGSVAMFGVSDIEVPCIK
jgi:hypothetical protein